MYIEELLEGEVKSAEHKLVAADLACRSVVVSDAKRVLVGAGARALFYPTLLYNVLRNKIQSEFRWWDLVDEFILLGAVPFPTDVPCLKELGVSGVVTLNEPYETLVPTSLYHAHNIDHLVIPTRDYLFAPSLADICQAVDFIHENASLGKTTYVHCKAGRGRSTTIVLCYLVEHKRMTPDAAYEYVRTIRPRVLLAASQWQAVQDYYLLKVKKTGSPDFAIFGKNLDLPTKVDDEQDTAVFDDGTVLVVTTSDLDGYYVSCELGLGGNKILVEPDCTIIGEILDCPIKENTKQDTEAFDVDDGTVVVVIDLDLDGYDSSCDMGNKILAEPSLVWRMQFASQAAISRLSSMRLGCGAEWKPSMKKLQNFIWADQMSPPGIDVRAY